MYSLNLRIWSARHWGLEGSRMRRVVWSSSVGQNRASLISLLVLVGHIMSSSLFCPNSEGVTRSGCMLAGRVHRSIVRLPLRRVFHSSLMSQAQNITPTRSDPPSGAVTPSGSEPNPNSKSAGASLGLRITATMTHYVVQQRKKRSD